MPLSDGSITPNDILNIKGPSAVQQYLKWSSRSLQTSGCKN
jgi:hypothetical protein